jgi:hypothetical protein
LREEQACGDVCCPVPCVQSDWSPWSECNATCGGGISVRTRNITTPAECGGDCPDNYTENACNTFDCPEGCVVSSWSAWSACSSECGDGVRSRTRTIVSPATPGGNPCPALIQRETCNVTSCGPLCEEGALFVYSACPACGDGYIEHRWYYTAYNESADCPDYGSNVTACFIEPCSVDCVVTEWSEWTPCTAPCGGGTRERARVILVEDEYGGEECPSNLNETGVCNTDACPRSCEVSAWSNWSTCSVSCGGGTTTRTRNITVSYIPGPGTTPCPTLSESTTCNTAGCPIACVVSNWTDFGVCQRSATNTTTCSMSNATRAGFQYRTRTITTPSLNGGSSCPSTISNRSCTLPMCVIGDREAGDNGCIQTDTCIDTTPSASGTGMGTGTGSTGTGGTGTGTGDGESASDDDIAEMIPPVVYAAVALGVAVVAGAVVGIVHWRARVAKRAAFQRIPDESVREAPPGETPPSSVRQRRNVS